MAIALHNQYIGYPIAEIVNKLDNDYYKALDMLCENAKSCALSLRELDHYPNTSLYVSLSLKMIAEVKALLSLRNNVIIPYISELDGKNKQGHDCRNCTGNCNMGHQLHMAELRDSHKKLKEILFRLQMVAQPLYAQTNYPNEYIVLRNEVTIIDTVLTELFYLEESTLIPKILEAQNNIHA